MLPDLHIQRYQEFKQALERLQLSASPANLNGAVLKESVREVQQFFHGQILSLPLDELAPGAVPLVQSYLTEIHKQLRLLATDVTFVQGARQPATVQQRLSQVSDRIIALLRYCEAVMSKA